MGERLLGERHVRVVGVRAGAEPGDTFVDDRGVFGIARTDGDAVRETPVRSTAVGIAAATERTVCSAVITMADLAEQPFDVLRLDGDDDECRARDGLGVGQRRGIPCARRAAAQRSSRRPEATMSPASRQPDESSPPIRASPILPAPSTAIRRSFTLTAKC